MSRESRRDHVPQVVKVILTGVPIDDADVIVDVARRVADRYEEACDKAAEEIRALLGREPTAEEADMLSECVTAYLEETG